MNLVRLAGILTVVMMVLLIGGLVRMEKQGKQQNGSGPVIEPGLMS